MHFIKGKWIETTHENFVSQNPATGEILWQGGSATFNEINCAVLAAQDAFDSWSNGTLEERTRLILRFQTLVTENKHSLSELFSKESGIALWESLETIDEIIEKVTIAIETFTLRCKESLSQYHKETLITTCKPKGIIALIISDQVAIHSLLDSLLSTLLAGNVIILKGSELIPLTTQTLISLLEKSAIPEGVVNLLQGKNETAGILSEQILLNGIFFIGLRPKHTLPYHKILSIEAWRNNNSLVVHEAEEFEAASYITILSSFITAGQRSTCARRLIVIDNKKNRQFVQTLASMTESLRIGPYTNDPSPFMGPLISKEKKEKALSIQALLGTSGGKPIVELRSLHEEYSYVSAGLIDITQGKYLDEEEYSAPLLQLIWVKNFEEAIKVAKQPGESYVTSLITQDPIYFDQFFKKIKSTFVALNCPTTKLNGAGQFICDKVTYPLFSLQNKNIIIPSKIAPGIEFLAIT